MSNGTSTAISVLGLSGSLREKSFNTALLRAAMVMEQPPAADLSDTEVLSIAGDVDMFSSFGPELAGLLRDAGAEVDARTISSGHGFEAADIEIVRDWLAARNL